MSKISYKIESYYKYVSCATHGHAYTYECRWYQI